MYARLLLVLIAVAMLAACSQPESPAPSADSSLPASALETGVAVHLFEWRWEDIATECEEVLGPAGYSAVQVSPPSENHVVGGRPWWERYQPVSYALETRSGTREQFAEMVSRCQAAGVDIYVDAVINHMTDADLLHDEVEFTARGTAGTVFTSYEYPGLYSHDDFHHCGLTENDDIWEFDNRQQVEECELVDLADLDTGSESVRTTIAEYLKDLAFLGVAGIRIDAARHMAATDIQAILGEAEWSGYVYQEVTEGRHMERYLPGGAVTDFGFGSRLSEAVSGGDLSEFVENRAWETGGFPREAAFVFVDNHDTQRHGRGILTYKDDRYDMAIALMLAVPGGRPRVMSSYRFQDSSAGPPADGSEAILPARDEDGTCAHGWECEHRRPSALGMVGFYNASVGSEVGRVQAAGVDRVAFARGDTGWIAFNRGDQPWEVVHQTGLPGVAYCDVASGPAVNGVCSGERIRVDAGMVSATVPPGGFVAIHVGAEAG